MVPEGVKQMIGKKSTPRIYEVTRLDIRKIADASGNRDQLYWDDDYAATTRYGGMIAPPDFFGWPLKWEPENAFPNSSELTDYIFSELPKAGYSRVINAGMESEFYKPVRPGDTLVLVSEIIALEEKVGKTGNMLISTIETTVTNQNGDLVARQRQSAIH